MIDAWPAERDQIVDAAMIQSSHQQSGFCGTCFRWLLISHQKDFCKSRGKFRCLIQLNFSCAELSTWFGKFHQLTSITQYLQEGKTIQAEIKVTLLHRHSMSRFPENFLANLYAKTDKWRKNACFLTIVAFSIRHSLNFLTCNAQSARFTNSKSAKIEIQTSRR